MGGFWSGIAAPTNEPLGGPGACFPGIIFKIYVPLRSHFVCKVEVIQSITAFKIITGSCSDAVREKMAEKPQENSKKSC